MPLLVYCISDRPVAGVKGIRGAREGEVSFVGAGGVWAAVSELPSRDGALPVADLVAFGKVVEAVHREAAVIPMRCGCLVDGEQELRRLLLEEATEHRSLLGELAGRVEMGIRILLPQRPEAATDPERSETGRGYLAARRAHYGATDARSRRHQQAASGYDRALEGLYIRRRVEVGERGGRDVVSVYYLVPDGSVGAFRDAFARTTLADGTRALVSGPWPPYNFAVRGAGVTSGVADHIV